MKKIFAIWLSVFFVFISVCGYAESHVWEDYEYEILSNGTVKITMYYGQETELIIPEEIEERKVTILDGAFYYGFMTSVTIPDTIIQIGDNTFYGCIDLTSVTLPEHVKSIGSHAFFACASMKSINLPDSVEKIGDYAFEECPVLYEVKVSQSSYAEKYCKENGLAYQYDDVQDWLSW